MSVNAVQAAAPANAVAAAAAARLFSAAAGCFLFLADHSTSSSSGGRSSSNFFKAKSQKSSNEAAAPLPKISRVEEGESENDLGESPGRGRGPPGTKTSEEQRGNRRPRKEGPEASEVGRVSLPEGGREGGRGKKEEMS